MAAVDGGHHMLTAVAHEDSKLVKIPLAEFKSLLNEDPALARIPLDQAIRVMRSSFEQG
jgi:CRP-like cAMP-binding protein